MTDKPKITASSILRSLRKYSALGDEELLPLWIVEHEKAPWVSCSYFAFKPSPIAGLAVIDLWKTCNLEVEPMRFTAGLAITRSEGEELPDLSLLIPDLTTLSPIEPRPLSEGALLWHYSDTDDQEMWRRADGAWTTVNGEYAEVVRGLSDAITWHQGADPFGIIVGLSGYGDAAALLMPIRPGGDRKLIRDPDLPPALFEL